MIDQKAVVELAPEMVGNGGLSLRRSRLMLEISTKYQMSASSSALDPTILKQWMVPPARQIIHGTSNEDVFFCTALKLIGRRIATRVAGSLFAMEQCLPIAWAAHGPPVIGVHKPWVYLPPAFVKSVLARAQLPEQSAKPSAENNIDAVMHAAGDEEKSANGSAELCATSS
jgi:hypothetical protein